MTARRKKGEPTSCFEKAMQRNEKGKGKVRSADERAARSDFAAKQIVRAPTRGLLPRIEGGCVNAGDTGECEFGTGGAAPIPFRISVTELGVGTLRTVLVVRPDRFGRGSMCVIVAERNLGGQFFDAAIDRMKNDFDLWLCETEALAPMVCVRTGPHIPATLSVSANTTKKHVQRSYRKPDSHSSQEAIDLAEERCCAPGRR